MTKKIGKIYRMISDNSSNIVLKNNDKYLLQMLILLYSDTNYVLDGFHAEFSVTNCPNNCTHHGKCINNTCVCENDWSGKDCSRALCPNNCSHAGVCGIKKCECISGYSGQSCSLHKTHPEGNRCVI